MVVVVGGRIYLIIYCEINWAMRAGPSSDFSSIKLTGAVLGADWWFVMQMQVIELSKVLKAWPD